MKFHINSLFSGIVARNGVSAQSIRTGIQIPKIFSHHASLIGFPESFHVVRAPPERGASEHRARSAETESGRREILAQLRILMRGINRICRFGGGAFRFDGASTRRVARLAK